MENQELIVKNAKLESLAKEINEKYKNAKESYASYLRSAESRNQVAVIEIVSKHDQIQAKCIQLQNEVDRLNSAVEDYRRKKEKYKMRSIELANEVEELRRYSPDRISVSTLSDLRYSTGPTSRERTSFS